MTVETAAQARIRWAQRLVDVLYYWAYFEIAVLLVVVAGLGVTASGVVHNPPHFLHVSFSAGGHTWVEESRKLLWDVLPSVPRVILEFYMAKTLKTFVSGLKIERLFSQERQKLVHKFAALWVLSFIYSFVLGFLKGFFDYARSSSSTQLSFTVEGSGDLIMFAQQIVFLLVILFLYDAGVQLQKDMDEVI
ncbi:hypothetical protein [Neokomagataea anthophila]|uniref:DUF2975 domain-containing protein n=1 Tax=Neokomagataea anthophila TaxID=2826925 RepID=A0ABS5E5C8_9PROT|nr:hypothetical protein [Neokomagataea anthophila]MBR0559089.1 hypothetical protein [Neokomagataea anthophila]